MALLPVLKVTLCYAALCVHLMGMCATKDVPRYILSGIGSGKGISIVGWPFGSPQWPPDVLDVRNHALGQLVRPTNAPGEHRP